jgi:hypothetical protein
VPIGPLNTVLNVQSVSPCKHIVFIKNQLVSLNVGWQRSRVLLHAAKLRYVTDGLTSPPKEGMLSTFSPEKSEGFGRV